MAARNLTLRKRKKMILDRVNHPHDIKALSLSELEQLGAEIRQRIMEVVDANGGHLASNLGSVSSPLSCLPRNARRQTTVGLTQTAERVVSISG